VSRPSVVFLLWGGLLVALGAIDWAIFRPGGALPYVMPAAAAAGCGALALAAWWRGRSPRATARERVVAVSFPTVLLAIGVSCVLVGFEIGTWLCILGGGLGAAGVLGLLRERRALR
jgi:hypothetical protein